MTDLQAEYAKSLSEKAAALVNLSTLIFNRPDLHDSYRGTAQFQRWRCWSERTDKLAHMIEDERSQRIAADA